MSRRRPLEGVRVLDFCWVGAGAYTTRLLADLGADVIKIESRGKVDGLRLAGPFAPVPRTVNTSGYFADRNASKRSVSLDLRTTRGREIAWRLLDESDIVANNFSPGVMDRFGMSGEEVLRRCPSVVYLSMSMMGSEGPLSGSIGYGLNISAFAGLHHLSGQASGPPVGTGTHYPDHIPNPTHAAFAVLAALRHARRTGEGQVIDLSQTEPTIAHLGPGFLEQSVNGRDPGRHGNLHPDFAPHGVYPCAGDDRWIAIAVADDPGWTALLDALGMDAELLDPAWSEMSGRRAAHQEVDGAVAAATVHADATELARRLRKCGVAAGAVHDPADVVREDPQLTARGHWVRLLHPEMGGTIYGALPFKFSDADLGPTVAAPLLGQHTEEVCVDLLGMNAAEVQALVEAEVLF